MEQNSKVKSTESALYSPYRKQISGAVLKLGEAGALTELKRKWWKEMHGGGKCVQGEASSSDTAELDIESVGGVFLVLGIGLVCGIIIGLVEFLWNVKSVAVDEKLTLMEALKVETLFALKFWVATKPVHASSADSSKSSSDSSSSASSHSKSGGLSISQSMKSLKSSIPETVRSSVHEKMRKIGSIFSIKSMKSDKVSNEVEVQLPPPILPRPIPIMIRMPPTPTEDKGTQIELKEQREQHHHHHHHSHQHNRRQPNETEEDTNAQEKDYLNHNDRHNHRKRDSKISSKSHLNV